MNTCLNVPQIQHNYQPTKNPGGCALKLPNAKADLPVFADSC